MKQQDKYCPMSANSDGFFGYCVPACAWYTDGRCDIAVLAQNKWQKIARS